MLIHMNEGCKGITALMIDGKKGKGEGKGKREGEEGKGYLEGKNRIRRPIKENNTTQVKK